MKWIEAHRKVLVAALGGLLEVATQLGFTGTVQHWLTTILALLTATGVYALRNGKKPMA